MHYGKETICSHSLQQRESRYRDSYEDVCQGKQKVKFNQEYCHIPDLTGVVCNLDIASTEDRKEVVGLVYNLQKNVSWIWMVSHGALEFCC